MKRPLIGGKDFHNFHWTRITNSRKGHGKLGEKKFLGYLMFFSWEEEENECVKGDLVVVCEEMLFMEENVCKQKSMEGSRV
jgi:hypothetical protein